MKSAAESERIRLLEEEIKRLKSATLSLAGSDKEKQKLIDDLEKALEAADAEIGFLTSPPFSIAYFVRIVDGEKRLAEIQSERDKKVVYVLKKSRMTGEEIKTGGLRNGQIVWISKNKEGGEIIAHASASAEFETLGELWKFERLDGERIIARSDKDNLHVIRPSSGLDPNSLKSGDFVLVNTGFAVKTIDMKEEWEKSISGHKPQKTFEAVRGLDEEIERIRKEIVNPFLDPDGARRFHLKIAEANFIVCSLLYGPPGCGKTLLAEAAASELMKMCREKFGDSFKVGFIVVRGSELLTKWLGETEGMIRDLLLKKTAEFDLAIIFWDEIGSMFPPRGMHANAPWITTHVSQFTSIIGGFRSENKKIVLLAADNRPDLIDPAVIRDGRFDIKIYIPRPDELGAQEILSLYLSNDLPLHESCFTGGARTQEEAIRKYLIPEFVKKLFDPKSAANNLIEVKYEGATERLGFKDIIVSGAVLESIIERAKILAYNRRLESKDEKDGVKFDDLLAAFEEKLEETEHLPDTDRALDDWLKTEGISGQYTVKFLRDGKERKIGFATSKED